MYSLLSKLHRGQCFKYSIAFSLTSFIYWGSENIYRISKSLDKTIESRFAIFSSIILFISVFIHVFIFFYRQREAILQAVQEKLFLLFCNKFNPLVVSEDLCLGTYKIMTSPACCVNLYSKLTSYSPEDILLRT